MCSPRVRPPLLTALSPDQKTLYVAGTPNADGKMTILAYDLESGKFRSVLVELKSGYADGLTVDAKALPARVCTESP